VVAYGPARGPVEKRQRTHPSTRAPMLEETGSSAPAKSRASRRLGSRNRMNEARSDSWVASIAAKSESAETTIRSRVERVCQDLIPTGFRRCANIVSVMKPSLTEEVPLMTPPKPYKGMAMEGVIASWYARNTGGDRRRFETAARAVAERVPPGGSVLEVAPGPGYLAIEIAKSGRRVTTLDVSESFVKIARENAGKAGVAIDVRHGNASAMPFAGALFDYVVCMAAFKNFTDPVGALNEMYRVLKPGGQASIYDLRRDASLADIDAGVRDMRLSRWNALLTRWIFRVWLLKKAYTRADLERMAAASSFGRGDVAIDGIGFEWRLRKAVG
jgi:ubiquinone/menaquinone biosynthesis C-methylase UbiE